MKTRGMFVRIEAAITSIMASIKGWPSASRCASCFAAVFMATQLFAFRADDPVTGAAAGAAPAAQKAAPQKMPTDEQKAAADMLDGAQVEWDATTGAPASIRGEDLSAKNLGGKGLAFSLQNDFAADAVAVMDRLANAYRLQDASAEFKALKAEADGLGFHHVRLGQMYQGLRVAGAQLIVHFNKSGRAYQVNGRYIPGIDIEPSPGIDANYALAAAQRDLAATGKPAGNLKGAVELVIYARDIPPLLAYELTLVYNGEKSGRGNWRCWINARDGAVISRYNDIRKSDAAISGNLNVGEGGGAVNVTGDWASPYYYLRYTARHWEIWDYPNSRAARSSSASWPTTLAGRSEMSAAHGFDLIQAYYYNVHNRNSYDNSGARALVNVHYHVYSDDYDNAFWDPDAQQFYFYPGSSFGELTVLDVCGHEFTHAVTEHSCDLVYQDESGALNESFSDIFGTIIEFASQPDGRGVYPGRAAGQADWLIGEDCLYPVDVALRDMRNPQRYGSPSKYHGTCWYYGSGDYGGVHHNCGVQNHFFYLLSEGGSGNNDGISYNLNGLGIASAQVIAYRALTVYCTPGADYAAARTAWISAADDLAPSWGRAVEAAWAAVGVIGTPAPDYDFACYTNADNTITISGYTGPGGAVVIPPTIAGRTVASIGYYAFGNCASLTSVTIPASVTSIWNSAFADCASLASVAIPASVTSIGGDAFNACASLTAITVDAGNSFYSSLDGVLFNKSRATLIQCPGGKAGSYTIPGSVVRIGDGAFYLCARLISVTIGSSVASIGDEAFYCCASLAGVYFKGNAPAVGANVFYGDDNATAYYLAGATGWGPTFCGRPTALWKTSPNDYDGDSKSDLAVYQNGSWYIRSVARGIVLNIVDGWGGPGWTPVPGDYDGDGKSDLAVYQNGDWYIYSAARGSVLNVVGDWGGPLWTPVPGDYDGDGKSDLAVYQNGSWYICSAARGIVLNIVDNWGGPGWTPVPGDYDGDGKSDLAVYRDGNWYIYSAARGIVLKIVSGWGGVGWMPVPGDYDGDGKSDLAVYQNGSWYIRSAARGIVLNIVDGWGGPLWTPVPGDYDGDGRSDLAVYRDGIWYIRSAARGIVLNIVNGWGGPGWTPVR